MHVTIDVRIHSPELVEAVQSLAAAIAGKAINVAAQPAQTAAAVEPATTTPISPTVSQSPVQAPTPVPVPTSYTQGSTPIPTSPPAVVPTAAPATQTVPTTAPTIPTAAPTAPAAPVQPPAPAAVPTAAQTYTLDQLAVAATQLVDAGRREELVQLLQQFGVQALTALPKEQYGAFATALRQMGAKI
ncbi:hypothetical protein [Thermicanus aegyptius]|uniref:hypothetical protein n=1 Tax=Thermicanus aegyptius TaxID=94009 RepID=UPI0006942959|nr:hypothetical protein [Thermicanus aegyptius]